MTDPQSEPKGQEEADDAPTGESRGPAQWVPQGPLSRFLVEGASWVFVSQIFAIVAGIGSQVFLARLLSPDALGIYFLIQSLVITASNIGEFGLNRPIARMISTDLGSGRVGSALRAVSSVVRISAVSGFIVIVLFVGGLGEWLALYVFDSPLMATSVAVVGFWIAGRIVLNIGSGVLVGLHRVGLSALLSGSLSTTAIALIFGLLLWTGTQVEFGTIIVIATGATGVTAVLCVAIVWAPFRGVRPTGPSRTRALLSSTLPVFAAGVLQISALQADLWIVGAQLNASDVALYGAARRLTVLVGFPLMVLSVVVPSLISDLYARGERERLQRLVRGATTAASLPAAAAFVLLMSLGSQVLTVAYGESYAAAVTILQILCAERAVVILLGPGSLLLIMTGHERVVFRITTVSATLSLLAIYLGGYLAGLLGVALGFTLSSIATGFWYLIEAHRRTGIWAHLNLLAVRSIVEVIQRLIR
jgi:O-antigen/teichoic acid export membrane protein